jgi:hypothetical protein
VSGADEPDPSAARGPDLRLVLAGFAAGLGLFAVAAIVARRPVRRGPGA